MNAEENSSRRSQPSVAERLNDLFASVTYESNGQVREYSTPHVAKAISDDPSHETTLSRVYLNGLRNGTNTNPTVAVVRALAKFFDEHRPPGLPPITTAYLLGDEDVEDRELRERLADREVRAITIRASFLDDQQRGQLLRMLDALAPEDEEQATPAPRGTSPRERSRSPR